VEIENAGVGEICVVGQDCSAGVEMQYWKMLDKTAVQVLKCSTGRCWTRLQCRG